jgi:two-component system, LytTR family, response regulator
MMMNVLIVDDEKLARERMRLLLEKHSDICIVGECKDGKEAFQKISSEKIDVVFLDIQMPEFDGIQLIEKLPIEKIPMIVFTTAYNEFAVKAFELNAVDYLLKPFTAKRFGQSLDRIREQISSEDKDLYLAQMVTIAKTIIEKKTFADHLALKTEGKIRLQTVTEIQWIESEGNYLNIHLANEKFIIRETMTNFSTKLDPAVFLRIHRTVLVNVNHIKELKLWFNDEYVVILKNGTQLPVGRTYKQSLHLFFHL